MAWLEHHLHNYPETVIAVTHDRYFLDNVTGWILKCYWHRKTLGTKPNCVPFICDDNMGIEEQEEPKIGRIRDALLSLPVMDDLYLRMQAMNIDLVDVYLMDMEQQLLSEYMEIERTPIEMATLVSAISQLWIFGLYELLRTWRQRAFDVANFAEELKTLERSARKSRIAEQKRKIKAAVALNGAEGFYWLPYEKVAKNDKFVEAIYNAIDQSERLFRRIEVLRVSLAKHEIPKAKGSFAMAPGYGRIDMADGSIYWQVILQKNEVDVVSRRSIADDCRALAEVLRPTNSVPVLGV